MSRKLALALVLAVLAVVMSACRVVTLPGYNITCVETEYGGPLSCQCLIDGDQC